MCVCVCDACIIAAKKFKKIAYSLPPSHLVRPTDSAIAMTMTPTTKGSEIICGNVNCQQLITYNELLVEVTKLRNELNTIKEQNKNFTSGDMPRLYEKSLPRMEYFTDEEEMERETFTEADHSKKKRKYKTPTPSPQKTETLHKEYRCHLRSM